MAEGLPTPKSREQILSEMLTEYVGLTGINDLNTGSVMTQFFDVVARSVARTSGDIFQILRDFSLDRATGEALDRLGAEERVYRNISQVSSGRLKVTDTSFQKKSTKIYSGASAPNIGSLVVKVSDASSFTPTGRIYIGRGTPNIEGPINYSSIAQVGAFWEITLDSPTKKFHNISESVILGQGGTRNIPVGTPVTSPSAGATPNINYSVSSATLLLDGETINTNVQVVAQEPGSNGNAPAGAIRQFITVPFPGAAVINTVPFSNGADQESDDDYRDRVKKIRLSRGLGTALAVKNAVLGAKAPDENARVTSNEIDTTNPEQTTLYIDNGEGYEERAEGVGLEFIIDSAIGGEQNFQLLTGGRQTSVVKAFLESTQLSPFNILPFEKLSILVGGIISEHIFFEEDFKAPGAVTAYEVVASINNNPDLTFQATTSNGGTKVVIQAKSENNEFLQLTSPSVGDDAGLKLALPSNEVNTVLLYKNRELLSKDGRTAFAVTKEKFEWSSAITDGDTLIVSVDGTNFITYTFLNQDFIAEGQHSTVSSQNTLSSWSNVINSKVTGVTAEVNGEQLKLTSNLGTSNRAGLTIDPLSTLVIKGMFSPTLGLSSKGKESDFDISRNTAQVKLKKPLSKGDSLNLGSQFTRAEVQAQEILGGQTTIPATAYLWLVVDDINASPVNIGVTAQTLLNVTKPGGGVVRYESTTPNSFDNAQVGDYVIIWSKELSLNNRLEGRINAVTSTTLDLRVTAAEESAAVVEGPVLYKEGFTIIRSQFAPQKVKITASAYNINTIASIMNTQLQNAVVTVDNNEVFVIRTNTEDLHGAVFIADFNDAAKPLNFIKNTKSVSISSQTAFYETGFKDRQFPAFIHGKITTDTFSDPPNTYATTLDLDEDIVSLGSDPSGFLCLLQPYNQPEDVLSTECVEIEDCAGTVVTIENSHINKRNRVDDRFCVINGYDFGHEDISVVILDNDPANKTFDIPLYRTAITNNSFPANPDLFRAYDVEGGNTEFEDFFGPSFSFDNYKVLMRAKNVIDPLSLANEDAILYRAVEWGRSGEKIGIGYFYPTAPNENIKHTISVKEDVQIKIFLKSGPARTTTIDGTTEWNVTVTPFSPTVELVTYSYSGIGSAPGLASINTGDYVSILNSGEFSPNNTGAFRIDSSTASSFTVARSVGVAVVESNIATLEINTFSFFESAPTTAQEITDYTNSSLSNYVSAQVLDDAGTTGAGNIALSTEEDSDFNYSMVYLLDGKNHILTSDLDATIGNPQFTFKTPLLLPIFSTNTVEAYSFNNGEILKLIPITSLQVTKLLNILAVTGYTTLGKIKSVDRNTNVQISTNILGGNGAIQVAGGTATSALSLIQGSASSVGTQDNPSSIISIPAATAVGFHADQWVKVGAAQIQKKNTNISEVNSIRITQNTPNAGFSKIEFFDKDTEQKLFGHNRFHTRTRGRTFRLEKQGEFTCVSWDGNGVEPFFVKEPIDIRDGASNTLTIDHNTIRGYSDIVVDTGDMRFDEADLGDVVEILNRLNPQNNGFFTIIGKSEDAKKIRVINESGISEFVSGSFTIIDNTQIPGESFTIGTSTLVEGVDFDAGVDEDETASNLAAAISLLPNIDAAASGAVVSIQSQVPEVVVVISTTSIGATASGSELTAPVANAGDIVVRSEIQEGDSVVFGNEFNVLNQGSFRIIRRFKNSFYIDNQNCVEEEVSLTPQLLPLGTNASTDFDIEKLDGVNVIKWAGNGAEPLFEIARPGDILTLGSDFNIDNQGSFHILDSGEKLQEKTTITQSRGIDMVSGQHGLLYSANDVTEYYFWFDINSAGGDPAIFGKTGIQIPILSTDTAAQVAVKKANIINSFFGSDFLASTLGDKVFITNVGYGPTTDASNVDIDGAFSVEITQDGRFNFLRYVNVNGFTEYGIVISDVFEIHREAIKFKDYEGTVIGDKFVITNNFLGELNRGIFTISDVLSDTEIVVSQNMINTGNRGLGVNFNKVFVEEQRPYVGYKKISFITTNPANFNSKNVVFDTNNQFIKINQIAGVFINAVGKLSLPESSVKGLDSYKFHTGLIAEANRIVYGDPRDNTTYPGVGAAGAEIFIKAPLVRRVEVSINVRIKTGVPFSTIVEEVRNSIAALINSNPVGKPIAISRIVSTVDAIMGVQAVAISSPQYDAQNDVIRINAGEKALVLDIISDILVSKID